MIVLRALGTAEIETDVTTLTPSQEIVFAAALYLILERGKSISRARLASLLWPNADERVIAHRLRQTILQLKKFHICVSADRDNVQLSKCDARSDSDELVDADSEMLHSSDSLEFLPGYNPQFSEPFRDWVDWKREETHASATRRLVERLNRARHTADWQTCMGIALKIRQLDPFNEAAVLAQAEAAAMRGSKREAIALLDRYIAEVGSSTSDLTLPASIVRTRIAERVREHQPPQREPGFVGRAREMETLISRLDAARHAKGGAFLITGEAGIGKSRLTSEIVRYAELDGIQTESIVCRRSDVDRPLSAFVDLVPRLRELPGALGCTQETLSLLRRLTEFDGRASETAAIVDDLAGAYARIRLAFLDLFDALADEECLLVVLEDIQWLDPSSFKLLSAIIPWSRTKRLFFLMNERSTAGILSNQISRSDLERIALHPLEDTFSRQIIGAIIDERCEKSNPDMIKKLLSVGEGNPFFLQELGKQWLETGKQYEFPPSVSAVVDDRLSRLSADALQVLQTCAVLGVNATIHRVEGVLEFKSHQLMAAVQELSIAGMLHDDPEASAITDRLSVRHDLLSTASLRRLAKPTLALLHRHAGIVIERETTGDSAATSVLWACAFHWANAGDRKRALRAASSCAEHLLEVGLPADAAQAFERVLEYCVNDEERSRVLSRLAVALQMQGQWERSKTVLEKCRDIRTRADPRGNVHDELELALFDATWRTNLDNSDLSAEIRACVRSIDGSPSHRVSSALLGLKIASNRSDRAAMEELYTTIQPLLQAATVPQRDRFEIEMIFQSVCGDFEKASHATKKFLDAVRGERDFLTFSRALGNAAIAHRLAGRKDEAEALFLEALEHATTHGLSARACWSAWSLVRLYLASGDIGKAARTIERAELITHTGEDVHHVADRLYLRARMAFENGDMKTASSRCATLLSQTTPSQSGNRRSSALALGIRIGLKQDLPAAAIQPLVSELEADHLLNRGGGWQDFETCALCLGLHACGAHERSSRLITEYATIYRRERWPLPGDLRELLEKAGERNRTLTESIGKPVGSTPTANAPAAV
jgi:DNA-binding SARP family transcriptional activator